MYSQWASASTIYNDNNQKLSAACYPSGATFDPSAAFIGLEYHAMINEWVDECCCELDTQLMIMSAAEFKRMAMRPVPSPEMTQTPLPAQRPNSPPIFGSASARATRRGSLPPRLDPRHVRHAALVQRHSERYAAAHACHFRSCPHPARNHGLLLGIPFSSSNSESRAGRRRLPIPPEPSPWPTLDAEAAARLGPGGPALSSAGFDALSLTGDELAVVAFSVFIEVRRPPHSAEEPRVPAPAARPSPGLRRAAPPGFSQLLMLMERGIRGYD